MYGMGNWAEVGEHVGTKTKEACIDHFKDAYLKSPYFPLPVRTYQKYFASLILLTHHFTCIFLFHFQDMTHVMGKNRMELLAMAKGNFTDKKG